MVELHKVYSGIEFNKLMKDTKFYKLTNFGELHNGFQFKDGLNIDTVEFRPVGECKAGGIYFTEENKINRWAGIHRYYRMVTIPDDARVYVENNKFKADKLILGARHDMTEQEMIMLRFRLLGREFEEYISESLFALLKDPPEEFCEEVLGKNGRLLKYMTKQTDAMRLIAMKENIESIEFVKLMPTDSPHVVFK